MFAGEKSSRFITGLIFGLGFWIASVLIQLGWGLIPMLIKLLIERGK